MHSVLLASRAPSRLVRPLAAALAAVAVLVTTAALGPSAALAADAGLSGRWDLDTVTQVPKDDGGFRWDVADASGHGLTGTTFQQPVTTTGKWGNAIRFSTGKSIAMPGAGPGSELLETNEGTLSLWFRRSGEPDAVKYLVGKGAPVTCENASYAIYTGFETEGGPSQPDNRGLQAYVFDGVDTAYSARAPGTVWDGAWHAVAMTFKDGFVRLHVDGQALGTRGTYPFTNPGADISHPLYDDGVFSLGDNASAACGDQAFTGAIDEVRYYSRALSDAEVTRLHDGSAATPPNAEPASIAASPRAPADPDVDGDGAPGSKDCNDADARIGPSAPEVKGNAVDENCDGVRELFSQLAVTSVLSWKLLGSGRTRLTSLVVEGVRDGDVVSVVCSGGGCPKKAIKPVTLEKVKKAKARVAAVRKLTLRPKAKLSVTIARAEHVSRVVRYTMVRRKDPSRSTRCLAPGETQATPC